MNILAIDLGSVNTKAVIVSSNGKSIRILGIGIAKTRGVSKGEITNMESAGNSIKEAVAIASGMCNVEYQKVVVNISSSYTESDEQSAYFSIQRDSLGRSGISTNDISKAIETAKHRAAISDEYKIIHILPVSFKLDNQDNIEDPIGMSANGIEVKVHIVKTKITNYQNLQHILELAGINTYEIVSSSYANAIFNCGDNEKEMGAIVIDMGGHICDISIQNRNSIISHLNLKVGSHHITSDISKMFSTPPEYAEKIKLDFEELSKKYDTIGIPKIGETGKTIDVKVSILSDIMYARVRETLMFLLRLLNEKPDNEIPFAEKYAGAGIIFTGGMTKVYNFSEYANAVFHNKTIRLGSNAYNCFDGFKDFVDDRANSCVLGLCMYGAGYFTNYEINSNNRFKVKSKIDETLTISEQVVKQEILPKNNANLYQENNVKTDNINKSELNAQEKLNNGTKIAEKEKNTTTSDNLNIKDIMLDDKKSETESKSFSEKMFDKVKDTILKYF